LGARAILFTGDDRKRTKGGVGEEGTRAVPVMYELFPNRMYLDMVFLCRELIGKLVPVTLTEKRMPDFLISGRRVAVQYLKAQTLLKSLR